MKAKENKLTLSVLISCYLGGVIQTNSNLSSLEVQYFNV